jgi:SAM-dependent methyltransferase
MELDPTAIAKAAPFCERVLQADLNAPDWPRLLGDRTRFDVVVAADVLEHLYDPWRALQQMVPLLDAEGYIVISLPHAGHAAVVACLLDGDFEYRNSGLLDRTHIRFFGLKNIEALFAQAQLKIIEVRYVVIVPEETDLAPHWAALSDTARAALRSSPYANIYQVVLKAVPLEREGATISLIPELAPQPVPKPAPVPEPAPSLKSRVGAYLSPAAKVMIRKGFGSIGIKL